MVTFYPPREAQLLIFAHSKRILQDACFDFAKRSLPQALAENGWERPRQVDLVEWEPIFKKHSRTLPSSNSTLSAITRIGEIAVHDPFIHARSITRLLDAAVDLVAYHFRDYARASKLWDVGAEVHKAMESARDKANDAVAALLRRAMHDPEVGGLLETSFLEILRAHGE